MFRSHGGARGDSRSSALWGTGNRGGEHRSSALWGTGNRGGEHRSRGSRGLFGRGSGQMVALVALVALALPLSATAGKGDDSRLLRAMGHKSYVADVLLKKAEETPEQMVRVIIQSNRGRSNAENAYRSFRKDGRVKRLDLVNGVAVQMPAKVAERLAKIPGLVVTVDHPVKGAGNAFGQLWNKQMWPHEAGNSLLWEGDLSLVTKIPTIAIVDSGIEAGRADFGSRILADVKINQPDAGDSRGHGTFVAGIAAGAAASRAGAAPLAPLVSLDVMDSRGMAYVSDVIAASEWILENKSKYNIRVANFSLHSARPSSVRWDPLARAVEKLWFSGVTVVAAAGNYGKPDGPSGVYAAPGSDPFVITVGALDIGRSFSLRDDDIASWSAWGYTLDGFAKPELSAPGRYMIGPVPENSTLMAERIEKKVAPGYIELSGTSFAAPVVAGTVAQLLARHPEWTPGQVKGALMLTARPVPRAEMGAGGVGQISVTRAVALKNPPDANRGLMAFVVPDPAGGSLPVFDAAAWADAAWSSAAWADAAWADAAWSSAAWSSAAWADAAWSSAAWSSAAWADAAWASTAVADMASEDNADDTGTGDYTLTPEEAAALAADPDGFLEDAATTAEEAPASDEAAPVSDDPVEPVSDATDTVTSGGVLP